MGAIVGFILVMIGVMVGSFMKGTNPVFFFTSIAAILIVIVGGVGATISSFDMPTTTSALKALKKVFGKPTYNAVEALQTIVKLATDVRRGNGLLGIQDQVTNLSERNLASGIQLVIDGADPQNVESVMEAEIDAMKSRHKAAAQWHERLGIYAPTFGIIGAVIGLVATMGHLDDPEKIGHGIAGAFAATFWGVFLANGFSLPWSNRLKQASADEVNYRNMLVEGVRCIQENVNPRDIEDRLLPHLNPADRQKYVDTKGGS